MKSYIPELDGFRAIAIYLVINLHFAVYTNAFPLYNAITYAGWIGVQLFFIMSGFLLSLPFIKGAKFNREKVDYLDFYKNRVFRIFPLYYISLIVFLTVNHFYFKYFEVDVPYLLKHIFFVHNFQYTYSKINSPYWSLAVEVQFYLVLPLIGGFIYDLLRKERFKLLMCFLTSLVVLPLIYRLIISQTSLLEKYGYVQSIYSSIVSNFDAFAIGITCAVLYELFIVDRNVRLKRGYTIILLLISSSVVYLLMWYEYKSRVSEHVNLFSPSFFYTILNFSLGAVILTTLTLSSSWWNKFLSSKLMIFISQISYSLYIWHLWILYLVYDVWKLLEVPNGTLYNILKLFIAVVLTFAVSYLSYIYIEVPFLKLKNSGYFKFLNFKKT